MAFTWHLALESAAPTNTNTMSSVPRLNPELMIIGDSLAQGCRSLTVNSTFCRQSWAARIAQAQDWEFRTPDFPRPILFDLEQELRNVNPLALSVATFRLVNIGARIRSNLDQWLQNARESDFNCFDNLGLSGAMIYDLYTRSAATSQTEIATIVPQGAGSAIPIKRIGDLHLAINGRFTLNPSQDADFNDLTPLGWVRARLPRRLLVQIGHNHGLYQIGSQAQDVDFDQSGADELHGDHGSYWSQWQKLAEELASLPPDIGTIVVVLLPKVGAVANLDPRETDRANGYAPTYGPVFSTSTDILSGERLAAIDQNLRAANDRIRQIVTDAATAAGTAARLQFLDTYAVFDSQDYKNSLDVARKISVTANLTIDNRYLAGKFHVWPLNMAGWRLSAGGFESIDGMHPSGCGYARLAVEVMKLLGLTPQPEVLLPQAFAEDSLLSRYPIELGAVIALLQILRNLIRTNDFAPIPEAFLTDTLHIADVLRLMHSPFSP
jgi:uncharacterized membrane protein